MDETPLVAQVAGYFQSRGCQVWYNPKGLGSLPLPTHYVSVSGRYPDLLAIDPSEQIIAVEAKGDSGNLTEGLGQALVYKKGAHRSFLAAPSQRLGQIRDTALAHGVGLIPVDESGVRQPESPALDAHPRYLRDVQRELSILATRGVQSRRIASGSLRLNHPLHYIAPILFFRGEASRREVAAALADREAGWGLGQAVTKDQIIGAQILGLVREDGHAVRLTAMGRLLQRMLDPVVSEIGAPRLRHFTDRTVGPLIDAHPLIGGIIRFLFLEDPDVRQLRAYLAAAGQPLTLRQLVTHLLADSPNIVLSTFCKRTMRDYLAGLLRVGRELTAVETDVAMVRWIMPRSFFQLKRQLIHVGILVAHPALGSKPKAGDYDRDVWEIRY